MQQFSVSTYFTTPIVVVLLALVMGALNGFMPDRWLPTSVIAWQKEWKTSRTLIFTAIALLSHVFCGYLLYLLFYALEKSIGSWLKIDGGPSSFFILALVFVFGIAIARRIRLPRIQEVLRVGNQGVWGSFVVFSLLGPCEVIIPIFIKSKSLGVGYLIPFISFLMGTWIGGAVLVSLGKKLWNRPLQLPRVLDWAYRRSLIVAVLTCLTLSLSLSMI